MRGLMMETPLLITSIMRFAERQHGEREVVSITAEQPLHRYTYSDAFRRARRLANALDGLGLEHGDRVATLAWNDYRHLEAYYAVSCSGRVCHTLNPRLFAEQLVYIINHAEDRWIYTDVAFVPLLEGFADRLESVQGFIVATDEAHMPETSLENVHCYESLLAAANDEYAWPELDENTACSLCYTSGTTGNPKGVLYSHRATVVHALTTCLPDAFGLSSRDCVLPVVPMFHASAWGVPYGAPMVGAKLVLPGPKLADGERLCDLIEGEKVTMALGVPTVWLALLQYLEDSGRRLESLERTLVGGAACPRAIIKAFEQEHGVYVHHGWGMTEMGPVGTVNSLKPGMVELPEAELDDVKAKQGRAVFGVDLKITDGHDAELPWDGEACGDLKVRGPFVCSEYFRQETSDAHDAGGWFSTGDVATIDSQGFVQITDRTKDVIKSGGEWISSIELENAAVAHPDVAEAAVIGVAHPKWGERPLLIVVPRAGQELGREGLLRSFEGKVARWWIPDDVVIVDELPHTATGKLHKLRLRERFGNHQWPAGE